MLNCPKCQQVLEPGSRFCGVCGNALESAPIGEVETLPQSPSAKSAAESASDSAQAALFAGDDPYVGKTLNGRFLIESKLGEGGFGAVYKGVQKGSNRIVALKLLHPEMTRDKNVVQRFELEGQVLCRLKDSHTVTTYDFDQTEDGTLFIAMELLEGRSLHDVLAKEAPVQWQRMLKILSEMSSSLAEAHALGIVHRDLKPENVHLEKRSGNPEFVKILDFGIAKMLRGDAFGGTNGPQLTATGQTLGTLEYMSPEQLMGKTLDGRSDIYGMGVLAFELMTGQLPFPDAVGPAMLISAQLRTEPPSPSSVRPEMGIPPQVDALILKMLSKKRSERFADVSELGSECQRILSAAAGGATAPIAKTLVSQDAPASAQIIPAPQPSTQSMLQATQKRSPLIWVGALLVLGAIGAGVALTLL